MGLSALQKYILKQCYVEKKKLNRVELAKFYATPPVYATPFAKASSFAKATADRLAGRRKTPKKDDQVNIITKSLERLINKGLLVGYGVRTPQKWFIKEVRLTRKGSKTAKELLGKQQKLKL